MSAELAWASVVALAACVCVGLAIRTSSTRAAILSAIVVLALLCGWIGTGQSRTTTASLREKAGKVRPIQIEQDGYISSQSCRSCHPDEHSSWHDSYHRTMTTVASQETIKGVFDGKPIVLNDKTYIPGETAGQYWIEMDDPHTPKDAPNPKRVRKDIVMITGSHHMQVYWFPSGRSRMIEQAPIVYWIDQDRWLPRKSSFLAPPDDEDPHQVGDWNQNCSRCHSTHPRPEINTPSEMYTTVGEFGISCEACHKPGEEHARLNQNPIRRFRHHLSDTPDESIVNPVTSEMADPSHACAQCHSLWVESGRRIRDWMISGDAFRPGDDLRQFRSFLSLSDTNQVETISSRMPDYQKVWFWPDGSVRVTGREYTGMMESPCHKNAAKEERMSCFNCHQLHTTETSPAARLEWANDQLKHNPNSDQDCLQCHTSFAKDVPAHTHHKLGSTGSRCANCHTPHTTYGLMTAIRSHQVTSPEVLPAPGSRPNACNQCHLDKTLAWTADHLQEWYGIEKPQLSQTANNTAASAVWLLRGDAVQRAIAAWTLGWEPAKQVSGTNWMPPYLIELMNDPYDAVRWMAWASLKSLDEQYAKLEFDFVGPVEQRETKRRQAMQIWREKMASSETETSELLLEAGGTIQQTRYAELLKRRDNTPITLQE